MRLDRSKHFPLKLVATAIASIYFTATAPGYSAETTTFPIPPDKFDNLCYFNSGVYSVGSIFCVKANTALICSAANTKNAASWASISPDAACVQGK
jgi:hypothetical protein